MLLFLSLAIRPARLEILETEGEKYYFEQGLEYFRAEEYELALKNFLEALELNPKNKLTLKYVNMIGNELKKREEQELLNQAIKEYQEQNYEVAISKLVQVLDLNPRNRDAIDYIQKIKNEIGRIEEVEIKVISEEEKPEAEKVVSEEISRIAQDIEIIKREVVKRKLDEPKELPTGISEKQTLITRRQIRLFLLFGSMLVGLFFTYKTLVLKKSESSDKNLRLLENLSKTATTTEHKGEILDTILKAFMESLEAKSGALLTVEDKTGDLILGAGVDIRSDIPEDFRFNKDGPVFTEITKITSPISAAEILQDSMYENLLLFKGRPVSPGCLLLVPLVYKNRNVGMVLLNSKRYRRNYLREYRGIIETLASQAAIIVANITYGRQIIIDGLTGLYVHWFFYQCLEKEISRAERQDLSSALLMVDLDHFKQFNDTYGHPMGDKALVKVAEILKKDLRDIDTVARYGGEEFAIILPGVDEKLALRTSERIRRGLESYRFKVVNGKFRLTLSIGISIYEKGVSAKEMVERADKALYWVKQHGRNQVKSWTSLSNQLIKV
jgi:diguanylate cyclase (GGDEF)-like protein